MGVAVGWALRVWVITRTQRASFEGVRRSGTRVKGVLLGFLTDELRWQLVVRNRGSSGTKRRVDGEGLCEIYRDAVRGARFSLGAV